MDKYIMENILIISLFTIEVRQCNLSQCHQLYLMYPYMTCNDLHYIKIWSILYIKNICCIYMNVKQ